MALEERGSSHQRTRWFALAGLLALFLVVCAAAYLAPVLVLFGHHDAPITSVGAPPPATPPPLDATHRVNILLLGSDNDQKFRPNAVLSQTMIVVSIDPAHRQVILFSIPRDLWVDIPGSSPAKIDAAYQRGGAGLARATVEARFKIPIHYYAWVGLSGLIAIIDRVGGVDVDVLHPILDETYPDDLTGSGYGYTRVYIPAGPQHLDGVHALEYVRSRHGDLLSDFGRSARQQQVLVALQQRASQLNLVTDLPSLAHDLNGHLTTDMDLVRAAQLAFYLRGLNRQDIHQVFLPPPMVSDGQSVDGQDILIPNWPLIQARVHELFGSDLLP